MYDKAKCFKNSVKGEFIVDYQSKELSYLKNTKDYLANYQLFINIFSHFVINPLLEKQSEHYRKERTNMLILILENSNKVLFISICHHVNITTT